MRKSQVVMPGWDWSGWFITIVEAHRHKVDEVPGGCKHVRFRADSVAKLGCQSPKLIPEEGSPPVADQLAEGRPRQRHQ